MSPAWAIASLTAGVTRAYGTWAALLAEAPGPLVTGEGSAAGSLGGNRWVPAPVQGWGWAPAIPEGAQSRPRCSWRHCPDTGQHHPRAASGTSNTSPHPASSPWRHSTPFHIKAGRGTQESWALPATTHLSSTKCPLPGEGQAHYAHAPKRGETEAGGRGSDCPRSRGESGAGLGTILECQPQPGATPTRPHSPSARPARVTWRSRRGETEAALGEVTHAGRADGADHHRRPSQHAITT